MTEDEPPSDPFSEGETFSTDDNDESSNAIPPLKVVNETKYLDEIAGRVLLEIYDQGTPTIKEISKSIDIPKSKIKNNVSNLRKQGYLGINHSEDTKRYFLSSDWGVQDFPSGPIIPLVYQYNLLSDTQRMDALENAIDEIVNDGDVVADLGAGLGILSHLAAESAEKVYAIEMDREVYEEGIQIMQQNNIDNIEYMRGDAREVDIPEDVDVLMCELLDTGLIAELQVPVMNYATENFLKDSGKVIPHSAETSMNLIKCDFEFKGSKFAVPHFEEYGSRESKQISDPVSYHEVNFSYYNDEIVKEKITLEASKSGTTNAIQLNTDVKFAESLNPTGSSPWLDPPLNLPLEDEIYVNPGDELEVEIDYELGGGLGNIHYELL